MMKQSLLVVTISRIMLPFVFLYGIYIIVHGDLSAYNILWWQGEAIIIDFPQSVDLYKNPNAPRLLARDLQNLVRYFSKQGVDCSVLDLMERYAGEGRVTLAARNRALGEGRPLLGVHQATYAGLESVEVAAAFPGGPRGLDERCHEVVQPGPIADRGRRRHPLRGVALAVSLGVAW